MKAKFLSILISIIFTLSAAAFAQDGKFKLSGSVAAGGLGTNQDTKDASKLDEYRDLSDNPFGIFDLRGRSSRFYLDAYGENLGRNDMYINLQGGIYGQFKFRAYGDWLTHNFGFGPNGARTPYSDPGSANLQLFSINPTTLHNTSVPPWSSFDFKVDRRNVGGNFEFSGGSHWYVLLDANNVRRRASTRLMRRRWVLAQGMALSTFRIRCPTRREMSPLKADIRRRGVTYRLT